MIVDDELMPSFVQDWRAYAIDGDMPYARSADTVLCITGDGRALNALFPIFMKSHESLTYAYERRQLYLAAEGNAPVLGFIAKAEDADPNDVMPFFEAWGIHLPWAKTQWVSRSNVAFAAM